MSWSGICENIIADIIIGLFTILIAWAIFFFFHRNKKLDFFGIRKYKRIVVYVANLSVRKSGALGIDNVVRSYEGHAVAYKEMVCANQFRDFFNYLVPSLAEKPNLLSKLLISDVKVEVIISPLQESLLEKQASVITLGSPAYNAASKYLQDNHLSQVTFSLGSMPYKGYGGLAAGTADSVFPLPGDTGAGPSGPQIEFDPLSCEENEAETKSNKSEIHIEGLLPFHQTTYGFIERINDKDSNRKFFYVAGLSELSTAGAAYHLLSQWSSLEKKYGKDSRFIRMVSVDPTDYTKSSIVFEK
jgi:hypothetical protein